MARRADSQDPRALRTRAAMLDATLGLVRDRRVEDISISQIVKAAGVSRQAFYDHFDDRDDAVVEAIRELTSTRLAELTQDLDPAVEGPQSLVPLMRFLEEERVLYDHLHLGPVQDRAMDVARESLLPACRRMADGLLAAAGEQPDEDDLAEVTRFLAGGVFEVLRGWMRERVPMADALHQTERIWRRLASMAAGAERGRTPR